MTVANQSTADQLVEMIERTPEIPITPEGALQIQNLQAVYVIAKIVHASGWVPKDMTLNQAAVCVLTAQRLRLDPFVAIQNTAVINGRPTFYGDLPLGICKDRAGVAVDEWFELGSERLDRRPYFKELGDWPDDFRAVCEVIDREGNRLALDSFSVGEAKTSKLWEKRGYNGKDTPWITMPFRMLGFRARGFALRRACPDVMMGLDLYEEQVGIEPPAYVAAGVTDTSVDSILPPEAEQKTEAAPLSDGVATMRANMVSEIRQLVMARKGQWTSAAFVERIREMYPVLQVRKGTSLGAALDRASAGLATAQLGGLVTMAEEGPLGPPGGEDTQPDPPDDAPSLQVEEGDQAEPEEPAPGDELVSKGTALEIKALLDDGVLGPDDLAKVLPLFKVGTVAELSEDEASLLLDRCARGLIHDDIERGRIE